MSLPTSPSSEAARPEAAPHAAIHDQAPHCAHCGFEMTPLRLARGLESAVVDGVYECRPCGVLHMPDMP